MAQLVATTGEKECGICFEPLAEPLALPCACAVYYCADCWDRALAASFKNGGTARCPSCRGAVRVDFDPDFEPTGRLVFTKEENAAVDDDDGDWIAKERRIMAAVETTVNRLASQAAPLMTRHLRAYGRAHPSLRAIARDPRAALEGRDDLEALLAEMPRGGPAPEGDAVDRLLLRAGSPRALAAYVASKDDETRGDIARLACVCGGALARTDGLARYRRHVADERPEMAAPDVEMAARFLQALDVAHGSSNIVCDVCDTQVRSRRPSELLRIPRIST